MIFRRVMLPLSVAAFISIFLVNFTGVWNDLLRPLVVSNSETMRTLPLGLTQLRSANTQNGIWSWLAPSSVSYQPWNFHPLSTLLSV